MGDWAGDAMSLLVSYTTRQLLKWDVMKLTTSVKTAVVSRCTCRWANFNEDRQISRCFGKTCLLTGSIGCVNICV
jgi:hypothetical protein